jgi:hypothetical protein
MAACVNFFQLAAALFRLTAMFAMFADLFRQIMLRLLDVATAPVLMVRVSGGW